jgi:dipeptidyl aminopeptidase/acylaminoacyl peptidase
LEHDDDWILSNGPFGWMADNQTIWFRSERDGYFHIYTLPFSGGKPSQLTSGKWEVTAVQLSRDKSKFYLTTSESHPGERHLYTMPMSGGTRTRVTVGDGVYATTISPDEKWIAVSHSSQEQPGDLFLMENRAGATAKRLTDSYTDEFKQYRWRKFEVVTFPDADNNMLYARLYTPEKPDPTRPAVIYVHARCGLRSKCLQELGRFRNNPVLQRPAASGLHGARPRLSRLIGIWARLPNGDLPQHGRQGYRLGGCRD